MRPVQAYSPPVDKKIEIYHSAQTYTYLSADLYKRGGKTGDENIFFTWTSFVWVEGGWLQILSSSWLQSWDALNAFAAHSPNYLEARETLLL